ncbi:MAG: ribonuclease R, partial [Alphaproteobacteria bacterium]|nr:ribonuclease R [Alphaproteobacteria bacterium]
MPKKEKKTKTKEVPRPTREQIVAFIEESPAPVGKREIARAFRLTAGGRIWLKSVLKELAEEGKVERGRKRRVTKPGALPEVAVIQVDHIDADGEVICRPVKESEGKPPTIYLRPGSHRGAAPGEGDRLLARLKRIGADTYDASIIRVIGTGPQRLIGVFEPTSDGGVIRPTDRKHKSDYVVGRGDIGKARPGDLVSAEVLETRGYGARRVRIVERLGRMGDASTISLVAIHQNGIPHEFPADALAQAKAAKPLTLGRRTDLRDIPLVTIDGADARDFDDAVWAEPDDNPKNEGGWHLLVAIADVSWYVRPGDALDRSARERGNSVYFPDRVVPMLPEQLSNDLCSLRPDEDRACMAVHMWIDRDGTLLRHKFVRGLMRSAARLVYEQVQAARDGHPDDTTAPLLEPVIAPLYGAYGALLRGRAARGTLELEIPERQVILGDDGHIEQILPRRRLDSHKLIEEFMISANVAAAEALEARRRPAMYRIHEEPPLDKLEALRQALDGLGYRLAKGQAIRPSHFTGILAKAAGAKSEQLISELILRSQSQAKYSPDNPGHFGLALRRYCHFTSPIRRYADLLVHRSLIGGYGLGEGALTDDEAERFAATGEHISATERRAVMAERDAMDRYTTAFMADRVGAAFTGRISGVTRFGLFVTLDETGADGLIPVSTLANDYFIHDEVHHCLVGEATGLTFTLADAVTVELVEADTVTGGMVFTILEGGKPGKKPAKGAGRRGPGSRRIGAGGR